MIVLVALAAGQAALGIMLVLRELYPAPPRLEDSLARLIPTPFDPEPEAAAETDRADRADRVGRWLCDHLSRPAGMFALPRADLALLARPVERFMVSKLGWFLAGLAAPALAAVLFAASGEAPPWSVPAIAGFALAAVASFVPNWTLRSQARQRRRDFRYAFSAYLQLVVLERQAGAALNAALEEPAKITSGWPFQRIGQALTRARQGQQQPWRALAELGADIDVRDLVDLAHTAEIAGEQGARMHDVLVAKITVMRHEASAAARSEAGARTTAMWVPTSLLMLGFVILIGYPFFAKLMASG